MIQVKDKKLNQKTLFKVELELERLFVKSNNWLNIKVRNREIKSIF